MLVRIPCLALIVIWDPKTSCRLRDKIKIRYLTPNRLEKIAKEKKVRE
jgi:hypothetical protein